MLLYIIPAPISTSALQIFPKIVALIMMGFHSNPPVRSTGNGILSHILYFPTLSLQIDHRDVLGYHSIILPLRKAVTIPALHNGTILLEHFLNHIMRKWKVKKNIYSILLVKILRLMMAHPFSKTQVIMAKSQLKQIQVV